MHFDDQIILRRQELHFSTKTNYEEEQGTYEKSHEERAVGGEEKYILTGDSEVIAEEGSTEGADDAGEDEVAGDLALVELGPPGGRLAAAKPAGHPAVRPFSSFLLLTGEKQEGPRFSSDDAHFTYSASVP